MMFRSLSFALMLALAAAWRAPMRMSVQRADVVKLINTATSADQLLTSEVETFVKEAGKSMHPKLKKRITRKVAEIGGTVPEGWAKQPNLKLEARVALKAATEASDLVAIDAAIATAEGLKLDAEKVSELAAAQELKGQLEEAIAAKEAAVTALKEAIEAEEKDVDAISAAIEGAEAAGVDAETAELKTAITLKAELSVEPEAEAEAEPAAEEPAAEEPVAIADDAVAA
eukprot:CAMPEP_0118875296 /NCGR_PEP_ID=MMETSP1163-20130328/16418_1 /TAXON_ID=124430 /ORGANISM="Phaeomonas parva, Strain CCMP2877" /LENGTH=228 /DNA_ID=CAMNT_0006810783 /DNA_START=77 /DNA_END=763 /DNA_ORIENTATION=-